MLKIACRHCKGVLLEADATWERAERTGMCPTCSHFSDDAREAEANALSASSEIRAETRRFKIVNISIGSAIAAFGLIIFFAVGLTGGLITMGSLALALVGGARALHAALYNPAREARSRIASHVDLRRLAREMHEQKSL